MHLARMILWVALCTAPWCTADTQAAATTTTGDTMDAYRTTYHRDRTVTIWDVYSQTWTRTSRPSDQILASLDYRERQRVMRHCRIPD